MAHARQQIRGALVGVLAAAGTDAGSRVFDHPNDPRATFPALVVTDVAEHQRATTLAGGGARLLERRFVFEVAAEVQQATGYAEQRDTLLAQVEAALATALIPGVKSIAPDRYVSDADQSGERPIVVGRQHFEVIYYTRQDAPHTPV